MRTIILMPVKNEEWVLESTLRNLSPHVDHIIIADQESTDKTRDICKQFNNVQVINNPSEGHSNTIRWILLEEARKIAGEKLIFCIDADECILPSSIQSIISSYEQKHILPGDFISFNWIQLWGSIHEQRVDGVWHENKKIIGFIDNQIIQYEKTVVINDHTARVPFSINHKIYDSNFPLLHFQFLFPEQAYIKQAWYRCIEYIKDPSNIRKINLQYSVTSLKTLKIQPVPSNWTEHVQAPLHPIKEDWRKTDIYNLFKKHGIKFFEPVDIWDIKEFHNLFTKEIGRDPHPKTFPPFLIQLNTFKNKLKSYFK